MATSRQQVSFGNFCEQAGDLTPAPTFHQSKACNAKTKVK